MLGIFASLAMTGLLAPLESAAKKRRSRESCRHASAEEANRRALAWTERSLAPLVAGPATAVAGPLIVHTLA